MRGFIQKPLGRVLVGIAVLASAGAIVVPITGGGGPVTPGSANLWIDTNGGTCTRQGTAGSYADAAACSSLQTAVAACTPGDTIRMKAGAYGSQTVTTDRTTPGCTVIAENGTSIGSLDTQGNWFELQNVSAAGWEIPQAGTNHVTVRDFTLNNNAGIYWNAEGYSDISWIGGAMTNYACSSCATAFAMYAGDTIGGTAVASNILIDGVTFDNIDNTGGVVNHFEVIRIDGRVQGLTIKNSTFTNNNPSSSILFFTTFRGTKPDTITLENNFFGDNGDSFFTVNDNYQGSGCANRAYRYNTFQDSAVAGGNCTYTNIVWTGNLAPAGNGCQGSSFVDNVWYGSGSTCSASDLVIGSSGLGGDGFHLQAGSGAIDQGGTGADCIATDHDGAARPIGARCDAGADEAF